MSNEATIGDQFVDQFYKTMDSSRQALLNFYTESSAILWNGNAMLLPQFGEFLAALPATVHTIQSYDVQPIYGGSILVTVKGIVKYGDQGTKQFSESFTLVPVVRPTGATEYAISNDAYRFV